jgi:glycerol-3-phosphate responsive antiterminator
LDFSQEFWLQILIYLISFAFSSGVIWTKLKYIEKKQDKHNKLIERMFNAEKSVEKAHDRIDNIEEEGDLYNERNRRTIN